VDFLERYLGISWDQGDGSLEAMLIVVLGIIVLIVVMSRRAKIK